MKNRITDIITRPEPSASPFMVLAIALVAAASVAASLLAIVEGMAS